MNGLSARFGVLLCNVVRERMEHDHRADMDEEPQQHRRRHHHNHHHLQILAGVMKRKSESEI
ncbi:hypothetical protein TSUD_19240 [Trifolium subterraneum]|uniref:Uncharacterized protein n=1 Tax=Trifolium subterraneum TaxID=3900 RepID=A0A2Z6NI53_TRISU|nr:hypothetical protein TSUD_19240 [Trifolium subterraneum]